MRIIDTHTRVKELMAVGVSEVKAVAATYVQCARRDDALGETAAAIHSLTTAGFTPRQAELITQFRDSHYEK